LSQNDSERLLKAAPIRTKTACAYGFAQFGGGVAPGRPGGPECWCFVSPQPQPGRADEVNASGVETGAKFAATSSGSFSRSACVVTSVDTVVVTVTRSA